MTWIMLFGNQGWGLYIYSLHCTTFNIAVLECIKPDSCAKYCVSAAQPSQVPIILLKGEQRGINSALCYGYKQTRLNIKQITLP